MYPLQCNLRPLGVQVVLVWNHCVTRLSEHQIKQALLLYLYSPHQAIPFADSLIIVIVLYPVKDLNHLHSLSVMLKLLSS